QRAREDSAFRRRPESARCDDERGDAPTIPSAATPHGTQDRRELLQIAIGGHDDRRDAMIVPNRDTNPRPADVRAHADSPSFGRVSFRGGGCHSVHYEPCQMIWRPLK